MRIKKKIIGTALIFTAILLAVFTLPPPLWADDPIVIKLARVLSYEKKYEESLLYYDEYLKGHPKDAKIQIEAGDVAFWLGDFDHALSYYKMASDDVRYRPSVDSKIAKIYFIDKRYAEAAAYYESALASNPIDIESRIEYARLLSYEKKYSESVLQYEAVLRIEPWNLEAFEEKGDVLSWAGHYEEAATAYDDRLKVAWDERIARQKARVLGWAKRYKESITAYEEDFEYSGNENAEREMRGKEAFWNGWVKTALKDYGKLLDDEPQNSEARFDRGQIEGNERMWSEARADFEKIVADNPGHFRAEDGLEKINILSTKNEFKPDFFWFKARSNDRSIHIDWYRTGFDFRVPILDALSIIGGYHFDFFRFTNAGSIPRQQGAIGLSASFAPDFWLKALYMPTAYTSDNRMSELFNGEMSWRPLDPVTLTVFASREDLVNQRIVFDKKLNDTAVGGRVQANIHRRWVSMGDYKYVMVNDSNRENAFGLEQLVYIMYEPLRLTFDLRFDFLDWKSTTNDYWSPHNFWFVTGEFHWRHYLNEHGIYYGAKNVYYGLKYEFQIGRDKVPFNGGSVEFCKEFGRYFAVGFEGFGIYSTEYWDAGALVNLTARF